MSERRPYALLRTGDQWLRCSHDATFLDLAGGIVELAWTTTTASSDAPAPTMGAGLAFDGHCRLVHSLPDAGRLERLLWAAIDPSTPAQPAPVDLFEAPGSTVIGDFQTVTPAPALVEPRGLAVDADERLFIAETGADRIRVFDLWEERELRHIALPTGSRPIDLAANGPDVWAVLAGSGRIVRVSARGPLRSVDLPPGCEQPSRVAVSPAGRLAVLAGAGTDQGWVGFGDAACKGFAVPSATDLEWESETTLVVARQPGADFLRLHVEPGRSDLLPPLRARGYDGLGLVAVPPRGDTGRRIGYWTAMGLRIAVAARLVHARRGRLTSYRLDSGAYQTEWGRVFVDACIPAGSELRLHAVVLDEADDEPTLARVPPQNVTRFSLRRPDLSPPMPPLSRVPAADEVRQRLHRRESGRELPWSEPAADDRFVTYEAPVIASPGRFLWLSIELLGNTRVSPKIRCLRAEYPAHDYLNRLPRSFSRDPSAAAFLQRYLAMFEGFLGEIESRAVDRDLLVDPRSTRDDLLDWLAGFVGLVLDDAWADAPAPGGRPAADVRRQYIEEAVWLFRSRGTLPGLKRFIEIYTGVPVVVVEHYRLRGVGVAVLGDNATAQASSVVGYGFRVGGAVAAQTAVPVAGPTSDGWRTHAHRFTVIIPAAFSAAQLDVVRRIIDVHRPAHTLYDLCTVDAGMRVGKGLLAGLTSVIGRSGGWHSLQLGAGTLGRGTLVGRGSAGARVGTAEIGRTTAVG